MSSSSKPMSLRKWLAYSSAGSGGVSKSSTLGTRTEETPRRCERVLLRERIDRNVLNLGQSRWERHPEHIGDGADAESIAFPIEIVVVGDRWKPGFRDEVGQGNPERDVHRDTQGILDDQQIEICTAG